MPHSLLNEQRQIEAAAFLRYKGKTQRMIAEILHVAPATVVDLIKKAEGQGLFRERLEFDFEKVEPERQKELKLLDGMEHLRRQLRRLSPGPKQEAKIFKQLHIMPGGGSATDPRAIELRLRKFAIDAVPHLADFLFHSRLVGVAYGTTLSFVVGAFGPSAGAAFQERDPIRFVPTCGEPYGTWLRSDSSSYLAAELDHRVNRDARRYISLNGIPAVIPKSLAESPNAAVVHEFIRHCRSYREIFGPVESPNAPLVNRLETILTSVGLAEGHWRMCGEELCEIGGIDRKHFEEAVLGDIGGVLLPKSLDPAKTEEQRIAQFARLWTGISRQEYEEIAKNAGPHRGVVVFAIGANKANVVLRAIELGLANHLVCDEDLALKLAELCDRRSLESRPRAT